MVSPQTAQAGRYDAFISYARRDRAAVERLAAALKSRGKDVWVDVEDILGGADWRARIKRGIEACKAFVFVLSPTSLASEHCRQELDQAIALNKLIIPVYHQEIDRGDLQTALADREWIFLRDSDDFESGLGKLVEALETDLAWRDQHTRIAGRTREWLDAGRDKSFLLRGSDLRDAETWLGRQANHREAATAEQAEFIVQSRRGASARQRALVAGIGVGLLIAVALAVIALVQRNRAVEQANIATARQLAAISQSQLSTNLDVAQLLAVKAYRTDPSPQTRSALMQAVTSSPHLVRYLPMGGQVAQLSGSCDGRIVVAGLQDGRVLRWHLAEPRPRTVFTLHAPIASLAVSRDGGAVVATDGTDAMLWQESRPLAKLRIPPGQNAQAVALSPSGRTAVVTGDAPVSEGPGSIVIFDTAGRTTTATHHDPLQPQASSSLLVAASDDELLMLDHGYGAWQRRRLSDWKLEAGSSAGFGVHNHAVGTSDDGGSFTYTNGASTIPVWRTSGQSDPDHPGLTALAPISSTQILGDGALTLSPDGSKLAVAAGGTIYVSPVAREGDPRADPIELVGNGSINPDGVRFFGDDAHLLSATGDKIALWDLGQLDRIARTARTPVPPGCSGCAGPVVAVAPGGRRVALVDGSGRSAVVQALDDRSISPLEIGGDFFGPVYGPPVWDAAGRRVALPVSPQPGGSNVSAPSGLPSIVRAWPAGQGSDFVAAAARGSDGRTVILVNTHGQIHIQGFETGAVRKTVPGPSGLADDASLRTNGSEAAIDPTSNLVAIVDSGSVVITDPSDGKVLRTIPGRDASFVTFSGQRLLVQRTNGSLEVWNRRGWTRERVLSGDGSYVWPPVADQQGTMVARQRSDGAIELIDLVDGTMLSTFPPSSGSLALKTGIAFTPDGTQLITVTEGIDLGIDGELVRRDISDGTLVRTVCETAGRDLTPAEWQTFVGTEVPDDLACR